jgi:hypothetical protein
MLQEQFQLRSRFSRPGLPNVPLIDDPSTSLEASYPAPSRRLCNMPCKRVAKKLKVTDTTSQEVSSLSGVVEYLSCSTCMLTIELRVLAGCSTIRPRRSRGRR